MSLPEADDLLAASGEPEARGEEIGRSREGRPIRGFRFGEGPLRVSLVAGCHADEPVGPRLLRRLAEVLDGLGDDHPALSDHEWWLIPHVNPDGAARNASWQDRPADAYDLPAYLEGVTREPPGDDVEFGFPRASGDVEARPENRAAYRWWRSADGPFHVHASLHGMAVGLGPWFLLDEAWAGRADALQSRCRERSRALGYRLHDEDRGGNKGFRRISEGFSTRPDSGAMRAHFLEQGDEETAGQFRPSSMETMRRLGDDALTVVSEMPLFVVEPGRRGDAVDGAGPKAEPDGPVGFAWKQQWRDRLRAWGRRLRAGEVDAVWVARRARRAGLRPMPVPDQMDLQWELVRAAVAEVGARRTAAAGSGSGDATGRERA